MSVRPRAEALLQFDAALARIGVQGERIVIEVGESEFERWAAECSTVTRTYPGITHDIVLYGPANMHVIRRAR